MACLLADMGTRILIIGNLAIMGNRSPIMRTYNAFNQSIQARTHLRNSFFPRNYYEGLRDIINRHDTLPSLTMVPPHRMLVYSPPNRTPAQPYWPSALWVFERVMLHHQRRQYSPTAVSLAALQEPRPVMIFLTSIEGEPYEIVNSPKRMYRKGAYWPRPAGTLTFPQTNRLQ